MLKSISIREIVKIKFNNSLHGALQGTSKNVSFLDVSLEIYVTASV